MALQRLTINGYGQLELNQVAFRRDGRVEAQCALDADDFESVPAENGMLLAVDNIEGVVKMPAANEVLPIALNYTAEHMYDNRANALRDFKLERGSFYPRLGYLAVGDKFTTNCIAYNSTEFADDAAVKAAYAAVATTKLYGVPCVNGAIQVTATAPAAGLALLAILGPGAGSMPDGQFGIKFQVVRV